MRSQYAAAEEPNKRKEKKRRGEVTQSLADNFRQIGNCHGMEIISSRNFNNSRSPWKKKIRLVFIF